MGVGQGSFEGRSRTEGGEGGGQQGSLLCPGGAEAQLDALRVARQARLREGEGEG